MRLDTIRRLYSAFPNKRPLRAETLRSLQRRYKVYAIVFQPRSGSTLLTELLGLNNLGWAHEWLNPLFYERGEEQFGCLPPSMMRAASLDDYLSEVGTRYAGKNGLVGVEFTIDQVRTVYASMLHKPDMRFFDPVFYLRRKDLLKQAVSLARALKTGLYHAFQTSAIGRGPDAEALLAEARPDVLAVLQCMADLIFAEQQTAAMFERVGWRPRLLWYEDLCADKEATVRTIAQVLGATVGAFKNASLTRLPKGNALEWESETERQAGDRVAQMLRYRPNF